MPLRALDPESGRRSYRSVPICSSMLLIYMLPNELSQSLCVSVYRTIAHYAGSRGQTQGQSKKRIPSQKRCASVSQATTSPAHNGSFVYFRVKHGYR
jgi:hypothetical protein